MAYQNNSDYASQSLSGGVSGGTISGSTIDNTNTATFKDNAFTLQDDGDTTKQAQFQLSGLSTASTRTFSLPDKSDTIAVLGLAQTFTAPQVISTNGAVSAPPFSLTGTWYASGTATTTKPQLLVEPAGTVSTGWNVVGTGLGVNAPSGFAGNIADFQLNGVSKVSVGSDGMLSARNAAAIPFQTGTTGTTYFSVNASGVRIRVDNGLNFGFSDAGISRLAAGSFAFGNATIGDVSGKAQMAAIGLGVAVGTAGINFDRTITTTGTTGTQVINKVAGTGNIAAAGTTLTITNSLITTSTLAFAVIRTADATATGIKNVVCGSGTMAITLNAACTAEVSIGFVVFN